MYLSDLGMQGAKPLAGARGVLALLSLLKRAAGPPEKLCPDARPGHLTLAISQRIISLTKMGGFFS